ncbi:hypothetical protein PMES_01659 [Profundibacterium mesophilum KAUST100406-0324]|uniref:Uncharacterized protein n=1 Tax=Profundibacterium mesophilum KAUST100406-0324 TaxID=1037889 RepID=A0A921NPC7_9RHOB|nr:hypothetical protein PMES_01659 [Profundibacterium mesophilum KAUST100406-0324]
MRAWRGECRQAQVISLLQKPLHLVSGLFIDAIAISLVAFPFDDKVLDASLKSLDEYRGTLIICTRE